MAGSRLLRGYRTLTAWSTCTRYVTFYEHPRAEMLCEHSFHQRAERGVRGEGRMAVEYFAPARLDDLLQVESEIVSLKRASLTFAQRILNADGQFA